MDTETLINAEVCLARWSLSKVPACVRGTSESAQVQLAVTSLHHKILTWFPFAAKPRLVTQQAPQGHMSFVT